MWQKNYSITSSKSVAWKVCLFIRFVPLYMVCLIIGFVNLKAGLLLFVGFVRCMVSTLCGKDDMKKQSLNLIFKINI